MLRARSRFSRILLPTLVTLGAVLGSSVSDAAPQLTLTWIDASSGQAGFRIERQIGATGTYTEIAQQPLYVGRRMNPTLSRTVAHR